MSKHTQYLIAENDTWRLGGKWTVNHIPIIERQAKGLALPSIVEAGEMKALDTSGAWALLHLLKSKAVEWRDLSSDHAKVIQIVHEIEIPASPQTERMDPVRQMLTTLGQKAVHLTKETADFVTFIGQVAVKLAHAMAQPKKRLRIASIARHVQEAGLNAVPIVALIAFLISIVLAYQGISQLRLYGGEIFTVNLVAVSVLREMGVLLTAIMVAGRSGSAFTAEIGVMKVNEEVDALRVMKLDPFEILVLPRLIALLISLPLLAFIANITGLIGAGVTTYFILDISWQQYLTQLKSAAKYQHFLVGMIKAPFFAFLIACVGCRRGLQVKGSAESVGKLTTISVVEAIFIVLLVDAVFSIFFSKINL